MTSRNRLCPESKKVYKNRKNLKFEKVRKCNEDMATETVYAKFGENRIISRHSYPWLFVSEKLRNSETDILDIVIFVFLEVENPYKTIFRPIRGKNRKSADSIIRSFGRINKKKGFLIKWKNVKFTFLGFRK